MGLPSLADWLRENGAHHDFVSWTEPYGDDWSRAWHECPRGDWLLALSARLGSPREALVLSASACARLALVYAAEGETRVEAAIAAAERWAAGDGSEASCHAAGEAAESAAREAPHPSCAASASAAAAAARSVTDPDAAIGAAALAVEAAVMDAGDCAMMQAVGFMQSRCSRAVREALPFDQLPLPG